MADTQADHRLSGIGGVLAKCNTTSGETGIAGVPHLGHIGIMVIVFSANVTVQGTRHLVEGTLEPIVGDSFSSFKYF